MEHKIKNMLNEDLYDLRQIVEGADLRSNGRQAPWPNDNTSVGNGIDQKPFKKIISARNDLEDNDAI